MTDIIKQLAIQKEIKKRVKALSVETFDFNKLAFDKQKEFFSKEGSRFRTAVCSRRSGKSFGIALDMFNTCLTVPNVNLLYLTITHQNVRSIIWNDIIQLVSKYKIDCKVNNLRMDITFPNNSRIYTGGVKDASVIEMYRGWKLYKAYLDECQSMRTHTIELINAVLLPALRDLRGHLYLTGTPAPVKAGFFYDYSHNLQWDNYCWTAFDNPFMLNLEETLAEERRIRGIDETDPTYIRETYGRWIEDTESLVYKYNESVNHYDVLPTDLEYILGCDIGFNDSDAIAIIGYSLKENKVYLVDEFEESKMDITSLAEKIKQYKAKYNPVKMVIDAGALGKKINEELLLRHSLPLEAAQKERKFENIEFLNADLRTGHFKAKKDSLFAEDCKLVTWDRRNQDKLKISDTYHSDIADAVLYAYKLAKHYIKPEPKPIPLDKWADNYMTELESKEAERMQRQQEDPEAYEHEQYFENLNLDDEY